ncbi:hypothetical protein HYV57_04610 [Candidatus Peregrinibacteria bacterium]|nr:hypothetical protein [Candidatus Peregrinibacteria bacterium]
MTSDLPETKVSEQVQLRKLTGKLNLLNNEDHKNLTTIKTILKGARARGNIAVSVEESRSIIGYNLANKDLCKWRLQRLLREKKINSTESGQLLALKQQEWDLEKRFDTLYREAAILVNPILERINTEMEKKTAIKTAEKTLGISLKPGTKIRYTDPDTGKSKEMEIESVRTELKKAVPMGPREIVQSFHSIGDITMKDGAVFSLGRLDSFLKNNNGSQAIDSVHVLEDQMRWGMFGIQMEREMSLEYTVTDPSDPRKKRTEKVKVVDFDDTKVVLDKSVLVNKFPVKRSNTLTLGEFFQFSQKMSLRKSVADIVGLKQHLNTYQVNYNKHHNVSNEPINVKEGEKLEIPGEGRVYDVSKVGRDFVILKLGRIDVGKGKGERIKMSFAEFLNWVSDNDVKKYTGRDKPQDGGDDGDGDNGHGDGGHEDKNGKDHGDNGDHGGDDHGKGHGKKHDDHGHGHDHHQTMAEWWNEAMMHTTWLAPDDIFSLVKAIYEWVKSEWHRQSQSRFAHVGKEFPYKKLREEMNRVHHHAEHEKVGKFEEALKHEGTATILDELHKTNDIDMIKACLNVLQGRGQIRWDDEKFHHTLNRQLPKSKQIPPNEEVKKKGKSLEFDYLKPAIDYLWGEGNQFNDWHRQNQSAYAGNVKQFFNRWDQLEGDPNTSGGLSGHIASLLQKHKEGEWVDPQEYEGVINFAIEKGKLDMETRMFYLIEGVSSRRGGNKDAPTLLSIDRIGVLAGDYLPRQHYLEFLTTKKEPVGPLTIEKFQAIANWWQESQDTSDPKIGHYKLNARAKEFFTKYGMTSEKTIMRAEKGVIEGGKIDHDDWNWYVPILTDNTIKHVLQKTGATRANISSAGIMNGYGGCTQMLKSLGEMTEEERKMFNMNVDNIQLLKRAVKAFVTFDSVAAGVYDGLRGTDSFQRLSRDGYDSGSVFDPTIKVGKHQERLQEVIKEICTQYIQAYGLTAKNLKNIKSEDYLALMYKKVDKTDSNAQEEQAKVDQVINTFSEQMDDWMEKDNGEIMMRAIQHGIERNDDYKLQVSGFLLPKEVREKMAGPSHERAAA